MTCSGQGRVSRLNSGRWRDTAKLDRKEDSTDLLRRHDGDS